MRTHAALILLVFACAPLAAQASLRIEGGPAPLDLTAALHRGFPAYPASALRSLGADLVETTGGFRTVLFGDTLEFELLSPFFLAAARAFQMPGPVYREGGIVYLPHYFFVEWLPAQYPQRARLDGSVLRIVTAAAPPPGTLKTPPRPVERRAAESAPARPVDSTRVVIVDPGHGGRDPGRSGPGGIREKDVALAISRRLATLLRERGYEVHLTRTTDTLIALSDRPRLANEWKRGRPQSLFVSVHANAASRGNAAGFETFFLSEARTEDERRVADLENAAVEFEEPGSAPSGDDLAHILTGLRNNFYLRASNDFAEVVQDRLADFHPGPNRGVKQAGFRVLLGAFMPAVLVETAFITNAQEARLLATSAFQQKVAWAIADAIDRFYSSHAFLWSDAQAEAP